MCDFEHERVATIGMVDRRVLLKHNLLANLVTWMHMTTFLAMYWQ